MTLDPAQKKVVEYSGRRPLLVLGGPGTGKTEVIAQRVAHLHRQRGIGLGNILVLTFSSSGARALRDRVEALLAQSYEEIWIATFYSFCLRVLRDHAREAGLSPYFALLTPFKEWILMGQVLSELCDDLSSDFKQVCLKDGFVSRALDTVNLLKPVFSPESFHQVVRGLGARMVDLSTVYAAYHKRLAEQNLLGLQDIIIRVLDLINSDEAIREGYQERFNHILVDEFHDTDGLQFELLKVLAGKDTRICVFGNADEGIYRFRGSSTENLEKLFPDHFRPVTVYLSSSHRCRPAIIKAAEALISHNYPAKPSSRSRLSPDFGEGESQYGQVEVVGLKDDIEEADYAAREIKGLLSGHPTSDSAQGSSFRYSDFAIICRSMASSRTAVEEALKRHGIPFRIYGSVGLFNNPVASFCISYLKALADAEADDVSLIKVIDSPFSGIEPVGARRVLALHAESGRQSLWSFLRSLTTWAGHPEKQRDEFSQRFTEALGTQALEEIASFVRTFESLRAAKSAGMKLVLDRLLAEAVFPTLLMTHENQDSLRLQRDLESLRRLREVVADMEDAAGRRRASAGAPRWAAAGTGDLSLLPFGSESLERCFDDETAPTGARLSPSGREEDCVKVLTSHQAKGEEFRVVFVIGMAEGRFPTRISENNLISLDDVRRLEKASSNPRLARCGVGARGRARLPWLADQEERAREERKLAYVAMTRASERLYLTYGMRDERDERREPSVFLDEIGLPATEPAEADIDLCFDTVSTKEQLEVVLRQKLSPLVRTGQGHTVRSFLLERGLDAEFICSLAPQVTDASAAAEWARPGGRIAHFERQPDETIDFRDHTFSASQIRTFLECPRKYFYDKLMGLGRDDPAVFALGSLLHQVLHVFHRLRPSLKGQDRSELWDLLERIFYRKWRGRGTPEAQAWPRPFVDLFPTEIQRWAIESVALDALRRYLDTQLDDPEDKTAVMLERRFQFDMEGYTLTGVIDRLDRCPSGQYRLVDYKSTRMDMPKTPAIRQRNLKAQFINVGDKDDYRPRDFQLPLYYFACRSESIGLTPGQITLYYLLKQDDTGHTLPVAFDILTEGTTADMGLTIDELEAAKAGLKQTLNRIVQGRFPCEPLEFLTCRRCGFRLACRIGEDDAWR